MNLERGWGKALAVVDISSISSCNLELVASGVYRNRQRGGGQVPRGWHMAGEAHTSDRDGKVKYHRNNRIKVSQIAGGRHLFGGCILAIEVAK